MLALDLESLMGSAGWVPASHLAGVLSASVRSVVICMDCSINRLLGCIECINCCTVMLWPAALSVVVESADPSECLLPGGDSVTDCFSFSSAEAALDSS